MSYPKRIETVHIETLDNELCIYDWQRLEVHNLNATAARVWQLCDGQTSPTQMAKKLQAELDTPHAEALVWLTLARLEKAHLLQETPLQPAGHKVITRRELLVGLGVAATLLPVVSSIVAPGPVEAQSPQPTGSQTFSFTGAEQQFIVPAGVTSVTIQAFGAQGGSNAGGEGGTIQATIPVTPGEPLFVHVGGQGEDFRGGGRGAGGFNGGGTGGPAGIFIGAGGGGASDVRQGGNGLNDRVIVAGGGGGACIDGPGWDGGYPDGLGSVGPKSGGGGAQTSGGAGGIGNIGGTNGTAGTLGVGGTGGSGPFLGNSGGGGGSGHYGGGGGGGDGETINTPDGDGGGGGGSGFVIPTATNVSDTIGGRVGNGQVIISW